MVNIIEWVQEVQLNQMQTRKDRGAGKAGLHVELTSIFATLKRYGGNLC